VRVIIQRTTKAYVTVEENVIGEIKDGLVILVGITETDTEKDVVALVEKIAHLRIFEDEAGKLNQSLLDIAGEVLTISQFTLYADVKKGRRPSFIKAARPEYARQLYHCFNQTLEDMDVYVATGEFGAMMDVRLINHGPVTIILETQDGKIV
jgi:D-tyrosyl-tRNA(Tyr) deacylase